MSLLDPKGESKKSSKAVFHNTTRCLKLTQEEARLLDDAATSKGVPRSEWMREVILRELRATLPVIRPVGRDYWSAVAPGECASSTCSGPATVPRDFRQIPRRNQHSEARPRAQSGHRKKHIERSPNFFSPRVPRFGRRSRRGGKNPSRVSAALR